MDLKIYNSLSNTMEQFVPKQNGYVTMYVCGPTVYNSIHIGNARPVLFFDLVKRYLEYLGNTVVYASNVTDVDDKIIQKAASLSMNELVFAKQNADNFFQNVQELGCHHPEHTPFASEYIDQMITFIQELIDAGYAYEVDGDVYFRVEKAQQYGILSNQKLEELKHGVRIDVNTKKENVLDFTLWKKTDTGIQWNSPFGLGRPGWHTECVCMIHSLFPEGLDIHGGGFDLKFPHHENEIAQYDALYHSNLSNYFMHVGRLDFDGSKMSKSLGNVIYVDELREKELFMPFRLFILMHHYRGQIDFTTELFDEYLKEFDRLSRTYLSARRTLDLADITLGNIITEDISEFEKWMNDDFNTPNVYTLILKILKEINIYLRGKQYDFLTHKVATLKLILEVLGINIPYQVLAYEEKKLFFAWDDARAEKDFEKADEIRNQLQERGLL